MKKILALILALALALTLVACGNDANTDDNVDNDSVVDNNAVVDEKDDNNEDNNDDASDTANDEVSVEPVTVNIASLKGPTTMGIVKLMNDSDAGNTVHNYQTTIYGAADEIVPLIVQGKVDIANVPANLAAVLYKKTEGGITVLDINTLGVLYVVETGDSITSVADLKGKTIYSTGKGTTPEYVLNYILKANGIDPETDVTIEFKSEATEVAAMLEGATDAVAVLPQPYVTVAMTKNSAISIALDLSAEWEALDSTKQVTGVTVVRNEFLEANPKVIAQFLADYASSVEYVNANIEEAAALVGGYDIVAEGVAKKALPYCNIVCLTGEEMKSNLSNYLQVLYDSDPSSVGGQLPEDSFYYVE